MFWLVLVVILTLLFLIVLHELGHFLTARHFGVRVDEFGIGLPPRVWGKKIGETLYSFNLIPFGAFVRIYGEDSKIKDKRSYSEKPIWQRALIISGGVISFWVVAAIILTVIGLSGVPTAVSDDDLYLRGEAKVLISEVLPLSPAQGAGLMPGDIIYKMSGDYEVNIFKTKEVYDFSLDHQNKEIILGIERSGEKLDISLVPRVVLNQGEGAMGVGLLRVATKPQSLLYGVSMTGRLTVALISALYNIVGNLVKGQALPQGLDFKGPVGIVELSVSALSQGLIDYLWIVVMICISLAVFNLLPIPALDGGKLLFLLIEKIKGKPIRPEIEQTLTAVSFLLLLGILIFVTIKDIAGIF